MTRIASLLAIGLLASCAALPNGASPASDNNAFTLSIGQSTLLADNSLLTYTRLVNDSRCAPDVQCVWEGNAEIAVRWQPAGGRAQELSLHTSSKGGQTSATIGERTIHLDALERGIAPKATFTAKRSL